MIEWTKGAKAEWESYCSQLRDKLAGSDIDAAEVIEDIHRDIESKFTETGVKVVTESEIKNTLAQIGLPDSSELNGSEHSMTALVDNTSPDTEQTGPTKLKPAGTFNIKLFGIILPIIAVVVELSTGICAGMIFDPLPTVWHIILYLSIPVSNIVTLHAVENNLTHKYNLMGLLNSFSIGVAIVYTIFFLPLLPLSILAILAMGLGFCSLSPLLALIVLVKMRKKLKEIAPSEMDQKVPGLIKGIVISLLIMVLVILPSLLTRTGIEMATSNNPETEIKGINLLRSRICSQNKLIEACYQRFNGMEDIFINYICGQDHASPEQVRKIYYKVTGKPYYSVELPNTITPNWRRMRDFNQGDSQIGVQIEDLSLSSSRMDASIDADSALGYLEWTMTFKNDHSWNEREARANIQLPSGAVVSRLTLWVNGEEREAAFASRSRTTEAYQSIVRRQQDPVLVTTDGPDRIVVQCFPVMPKGKEMKIRIGITVPLNITSDKEAELRLPYFNARNFDIPVMTTHAIWVESKQVINNKTENFISEQINNYYAYRGELTDKQISGESGVIKFSRDGEISATWSQDPLSDKMCIKQTISETTEECPELIVIVIDASLRMEPFFEDIAETLEKIPGEAKVSLLIANDAIDEFASQPVAMSDKIGKALADRIRKVEIKGGADNIPALKKAWDIASTSQKSVIFWLYAGQPHIYESPETLIQRWERRPEGPEMILAQVCPGIDEVSKSLDIIPKVSSLISTGNIKEDLKRQFEIWDGKPSYRIYRTKVKKNESQTEKNKTSDHLARLYSYDIVNYILNSNIKDKQEQALAISTNYQLVTPVSGAVVLETAEQYEDNGLQPVDPATVPTIPEPEVWAMMIIVFIIIGWMLFKRYHSYKMA